ncbi:hypothetical protein CLAIMM_15221 [Cladophialophora immunda]|nr:hypothetical protein CLAIMM_15221 [Cladophialophora immunda]
MLPCQAARLGRPSLGHPALRSHVRPFLTIGTLYLLFQSFLLPGTIGLYMYAVSWVFESFEGHHDGSFKKQPPSFWKTCLKNLDPRSESERRKENSASKRDEPGS